MVTGLDIAPAMLDRTRMLAGDLPVDWVLADCRTMQLGRQFEIAIMTSHGFQHLLTDEDQEALLARMNEHIVPGGILAFETRNLGARSYASADDEPHRSSFQTDDGQQVDVTMQAQYDEATKIDHVHITQVAQDTGERRQSTTALRYTDVDELNDRLERQGFRVREQFGFWDRQPVRPDLPEIITICECGA